MRRLWPALLIPVYLSVGCSEEIPEPDKVALFLFDASWSCKEQRDRYRRDFRSKLLKMEGTRVYVDLIEASRVPEYPVAFDVPKRKGALSQYSEDYDRERARIADAADAELQALFRQHDERVFKGEGKVRGSTTGTSPILTLSLVKLFERDEIRDMRSRELTVFTDGIEQSAELDLTSKKLNLENIEEEIAKLEQIGLVPKLKGVTVSMGGLTVGKDKQLTAAQIILIRRFWERYFERTGARFNPASLDGSVVD